MANYPQELAQGAVCQSHTGHMTGLWFLPARPLRLHTNELMTAWKSSVVITLEILRNISDLHCARCISAALSQIDVSALLFIVMNSIYMSYTRLFNFRRVRKFRKATINIYHTAHRLWCVHLKSASYERTVSGALWPFKCSVHTCRGLEL